MNDQKSQPLSWEQLQLLDADLVQIRYTIGVWKSRDHSQFELEVTDPASGSTIALSSRWHATLAQALSTHEVFSKDLLQRLEDLTGPF